MGKIREKSKIQSFETSKRANQNLLSPPRTANQNKRNHLSITKQPT
jgi:hypothetical protein